MTQTPLAPTRAARKRESRTRILDTAARKLREDGLSGAAIAPIMQAAGLTHGAFYAHFRGKEDLAVAAFRQAFVKERRGWIGKVRARDWPARARRLAATYLTRRHRDMRGDGCALAALAADAARAPAPFRAAYAEELSLSLQAIRGLGPVGAPPDGPIEAPIDGDEAPDAVPCAEDDQAMALMALCLGGLSLARACGDPALSDRILAACRAAAGQLADAAPTNKTSET